MSALAAAPKGRSTLLDSVPEPGFRDVLRGFGALRSVTDESAFVRQLCAPWRREGDFAFWLSRSAWSFAAIADALIATRQGRPVFLVPEYFCDTALGPLRQRAIDLRFYPVGADGWPDWTKIEAAGGRVDFFLLVHFFGHASNGARARQFCDARNAILVEDATHAMGPSPGIGESGDFVCYSPWKFFPIPNGAVLIRRPDCPLAPEPLIAAMHGLGDRSSPGLGWVRRSFSAACDRWLGRAPKSFPANDFFADPLATPMPQRPRAAFYAAQILMTYDVAEAARGRRENDAAIRRHFSGAVGLRPFAARPDGPWRSVLRADGPESAARAHDALRAAGIEAECWPPLPPEVKGHESEAQRLRRTLVCLPCHQGFTPDQISEALRRSGVGM
jgi:hypothetical protein